MLGECGSIMEVGKMCVFFFFFLVFFLKVDLPGYQYRLFFKVATNTDSALWRRCLALRNSFRRCLSILSEMNRLS